MGGVDGVEYGGGGGGEEGVGKKELQVAAALYGAVVRPRAVDEVEEGDVGNAVLHVRHMTDVKWEREEEGTYTGISATGAEMGIPMILQISFFLWKASRCVASVRITPDTLSVGINDLGYTTSTLSVPSTSCVFLLSDRGGTDLRPHSS